MSSLAKLINMYDSDREIHMRRKRETSTVPEGPSLHSMIMEGKESHNNLNLNGYLESRPYFNTGYSSFMEVVQ